MEPNKPKQDLEQNNNADRTWNKTTNRQDLEQNRTNQMEPNKPKQDLEENKNKTKTKLKEYGQNQTKLMELGTKTNQELGQQN